MHVSWSSTEMVWSIQNYRLSLILWLPLLKFIRNQDKIWRNNLIMHSKCNLAQIATIKKWGRWVSILHHSIKLKQKIPKFCQLKAWPPSNLSKTPSSRLGQSNWYPFRTQSGSRIVPKMQMLSAVAKLSTKHPDLDFDLNSCAAKKELKRLLNHLAKLVLKESQSLSSKTPWRHSRPTPSNHQDNHWGPRPLKRQVLRVRFLIRPRVVPISTEKWQVRDQHRWAGTEHDQH